MLFNTILSLSLAALAIATPRGPHNDDQKNWEQQNGNNNGNSNANSNSNGNGGNNQNANLERPGQNGCSTVTVTETATCSYNKINSRPTSCVQGSNNADPTSDSCISNIIYLAGMEADSCLNPGSRTGNNDPYMRIATVPTDTTGRSTGSCVRFSNPISSLSLGAYPANMDLPDECTLWLFTDQNCGFNTGSIWNLGLSSGVLGNCQDSKSTDQKKAFKKILSAQVVCDYTDPHAASNW